MPELTAPFAFPMICDSCAESLKGEAVGDVLICRQCGAKHRGQRVSLAAQDFAHLEKDASTDETFEVIESTPDLLRFRLKRLARPQVDTGFEHGR